MTPEEQVFNNKISNDPLVKALNDEVTILKNSQKEVKESFDKEVMLQKEFKEYVQAEFEKGSDRFKEFEGDISEVKNDMNELKNEVRAGFKGVNQSISNLKEDLANDEIKKLREELGARNSFKRTIIAGVIITIATIFLTAIFSNLPSVTFEPMNEKLQGD